MRVGPEPSPISATSRSGTDPQLSPWLEGRSHVHPAVHRAQDAISAHPSRPWTVATLAALAATSPRHLSRLFNAHVGMGVSDYVNRIRVALARELVAGSSLSLERVAERTGFASTRQFRRAWSRYHAGPPSGLRADQRLDGPCTVGADDARSRPRSSARGR